MRILMVNYEYPPLGGGGGIAQRDVARALGVQHDVVVLTSHAGDLPFREIQDGVTVLRVPVWHRTDLATATIRSMVSFVPAAYRGGVRAARERMPDVVHAYFAVPSGVPAVLLGRTFRRPVVVTLVGADVFDPIPTAGVATHRNPLVRRVVRSVIRAADARVAISRDTRNRALQYHAAPKDIEVIPLGFVPPEVGGTHPDSEGERGRGEQERAFRFMTVGRLIPRKGYDTLLRAFAELGRPDARLDIIGDGPLLPRLMAIAGELGLGDRVSFLGAVPEDRKWELLRNADCFVSASLHEGFGIVFLEAMSVGLPVIATDRGGQTDILLQGENALLVPPEHPAQLRAAMRWLMDDDTLRRRLSQKGRACVHPFSIQETTARYEAVFHRVLERRGLPIPAMSSAAPIRAAIDPPSPPFDPELKVEGRLRRAGPPSPSATGLSVDLHDRKRPVPTKLPLGSS